MISIKELAPTIIQATIAFLGVLMSVLLSYLMSSRKLKLETDNLIEAKKKAFNDLLQAERLRIYPEIYETASSFVKQFRTSDNVPVEKLQALNNELAKHDSKSGIFYSTNTTFHSAALM